MTGWRWLLFAVRQQPSRAVDTIQEDEVKVHTSAGRWQHVGIAVLLHAMGAHLTREALGLPVLTQGGDELVVACTGPVVRGGVGVVP